MVSNQRKDERKGLRELSLMAVPGLAGMGLFVWGLKLFERAGAFCSAGTVLLVSGSLLLVLSLGVYWWTDFRGKREGQSFLGFLLSVAGTAVSVVLMVRFLG